FRKDDSATPLVLMGYYNPIYIYGVDRFLADAKTAGVDGLIAVDLPPEEDAELCLPAMKAGLNFIRLATPTTDEKRLPTVLTNTSGFVYYVSITGITGAAAPDTGKVAAAVARIKRHTKLPVCVGFGVRTAAHARAIAETADGVVVGSALVDAVRHSLGPDGKPISSTIAAVTDLVRALAEGVRAGRMHRELFRPSTPQAHLPAWEPPVDILETELEVLVLVALPGVDPDDAQALIEDGDLVIAGTRVVPEQLRTATIHRLELPQGR